MAERFLRGSSKLCQGVRPHSGDLPVGLDRVCARATLPLSGTGRILKTDSKTYALVLLLGLGDFPLRRNRLVEFDLRQMCTLPRNILIEGHGQLLAVVGEELRIVRSA